MQDLLQLHGNTKTSLRKFQINYIGEASIVGIRLRMMIELWDIWNEKTNRQDKATKQQKRIAKISLQQV